MEFSNYFNLFSIIQKSLPTSLSQREEAGGRIPPLEKGGLGGIGRIVFKTNRFPLPSSLFPLLSPLSLLSY